MKKFFIIISLLLLTAIVQACDICGCSSGNYFIGPFPIFHRYFVGTRYTVRSFRTILKDDPGQFSKDFYQTAEIWGGYNIGKRWQVLAFVPYNINRQRSDDGTRHTQGMGDITLMGSYELLGNKNGPHKLGGISQQLRLGGGVKIPTGKYSVDPDELVPSANSQPGSGSIDFITSLQYNIYKKNWGFSSSTTYKINQQASGFQFGNRFSESAFLFRSFVKEKCILSPDAGIVFEKLAANRSGGVKVDQTESSALMVAAGLEITSGNWMFGANLQHPLYQDIADGQTKNRIRGMMHVGYSF